MPVYSSVAPKLNPSGRSCSGGSNHVQAFTWEIGGRPSRFLTHGSLPFENLGIGLGAPEERFTLLPPHLRHLALPFLLSLRTPSPLWLHHRRDNKSSYGSSGFWASLSLAFTTQVRAEARRLELEPSESGSISLWELQFFFFFFEIWWRMKVMLMCWSGGCGFI